MTAPNPTTVHPAELSAESVAFSFAQFSLSPISMHARAGELTAIITTLVIVSFRSTLDVVPEVAHYLASNPALGRGVGVFMDLAPFWLTLLATISSVTSGVDFLWKNREFLGERRPA